MPALPVLALALALGALDSPTTTRATTLARQALVLGSSPRGAAPLIRLHGLLDEVDDLNLLAEPYAALLSRGGTDREVRLLARLFYSDLERARGRTTKAAELLEPLGFIQDFYVTGGFENEGKGGCDTDFGPEAAVDLTASYPGGGGRERVWRKLAGKSLDGTVDLSNALKPSNEAIGYALTFLAAEKETSVVLGVGSPGAFRLFVNGAKVAGHDRYNQPRVDQARVQVRLRKGLNRVLLKVCQEKGPFSFVLRQTRADKAPAGAKVVLPEVVPPLERGPAPSPQALPTLADALQGLLKSKSDDAALKADVATVLAFTRSTDEKEHLPATLSAQAAESKGAPAELSLTAASLDTDDANARRAHLQRALALEPSNPFARLFLAQHELSMEHPDLALTQAQALRKDFPDFAPAALVEARALDALGQRVAALEAVEAAFLKLKNVPALAREAAAVSRRYERLGEAEARLRMALALRYDDTTSRRVLAGLLADTGKVEASVEQLERVLALDAFDNGTRVRLAELLLANGSTEAALKAFAEARAHAPDDPEVAEKEGRALLFLSRKDEALLAFQRALLLRPQNPGLKEVVRTLRDEESTSGTQFAFDLQPLKGLAAPYAKDDAVYLAEVNAVRVQSSGLSSRFHQVAVQVNTQRGVEAFRQLPITYSPDRQEVRVLKARITKPDGSIVESFGDADRNINEPWTGMYYDARARILSFPALAAGDVLEVQWRLEDTAADNLLSDYWGDVDALQSTFPKVRYRYVVEMPKERPLQWNAATLPPYVTASHESKGSTTTWRFEAREVARIVPEPNMPGWAEVSGVLHLSTYQTWDQVGRYWWGLVRDQLTPNDELKKTVETVLKGVDRADARKVTEAIYGFVVTNTRYVALEFGIHGFKPYRVDRVLARRFGDCKDKASLIVAMLQVAGVDARLVLLRMRSLGALSGEPASLAAFNHAIAYVPKLDLFLDGTAEFHGTRDLPGADRVANVLVVEPGGNSRFLTTPEADPASNLSEVKMAVTLAADGSAEVGGEVSTAGQGAPEQRRAYQSASTRKSVFEQAWAQSFPGLSVSKVEVSDVTKLEQPLKVSFSLGAPRYSEAAPGALRFYAFGAGRQFTNVLAPLSERKTDALFPGVWVNRFSFTYRLPAGYLPAELPPDLTESSAFGTLSVTTKVVEGKLVAEATMTMKVARIPAKDYPAFRDFLLRVDQAFSRKVTARKLGGQTAQR